MTLLPLASVGAPTRVSPDTTRRYSLDGPGRVLCARGHDTLWVTTLTRTEQFGDLPPHTRPVDIRRIEVEDGRPVAYDEAGWATALDPVTGRKLEHHAPLGPGLILSSLLLVVSVVWWIRRSQRRR